MKLALRIFALGLIVAAGVVGNTLPRPQTLSAIHQASVPGPTPTCNPFVQKCGNIR